MTEIIGQIFGIVGMLFNIFSFQCKKNTHLIAVLGIGSLMFSLNYLLIGAFAGAGFNIVNILLSMCVINKKMHNNPMFVFVCAVYILISVFAYDGLWTLVLLFSQLAKAFAIWYKTGGFIRKTQLFCISPVWLINNMIVSFSIGGIICEAFTIISVIVSFFRLRKTAE